MFLAILGIFLKIIGILIAAPNAIRHFRNWKHKEVARLTAEAYVFRKTGRKQHYSKSRKFIYRLIKMPNPHLWAE